MRILMVSEDLPGAQVGGLGKHVVTLANALLARGHEVQLLGRGDVAGGSAAQVGFHGRLIPGFGWARPGWKELQLGVFNPLKRPWFARKVAHAINRHAAGFDVVHYHGHLPMTGLYVAPGINYVQTRHDQGSECLTHLRFYGGAPCATVDARDCARCIRADAGALRQAVSAIAVDGYRRRNALSFAIHKTVFVSDFLRRQFRRAVPDADLSRCRVIHNFVDYARLARLTAAAGEPEPGHIVLVGRIDAGKGFAEFLDEVAHRLPPGARISIAGDGPLRAELEQRYGGGQRSGARVGFLGWQPYDDVARLCARAHLCVVPSVCEEACSTTVLEALALGRPCVALARGGTPELADYQLYPGQLRLAGSMPELADRVLDLLTHPPRCTVLAASFGADAASTLDQLLDFYAA